LGNPTSKIKFGISVKLAIGQERVLVPSSLLLAFNSYCKDTDKEGRYELAIIFWLMNQYYKSSNNIKIGSEGTALQFAMDTMREGNIQFDE
jgi:Zn finger protein HypA/HybF involved in hydrogenase expression